MSSKIVKLRATLLTTSGKEQVDILHQLTKEYLPIDLEQAIIFAEEALTEAKNQNIPISIADSYYLKGQVLLKLGQFERSIKCFNTALKFIKSIPGYDLFSTAKIYNSLAGIYKLKGDYNLALSYLLQAVNTLEKDFDRYQDNLTGLYTNVAIIYYRNEDYDEGLKYIQKAYELIKHKTDSRELMYCFNTFGNIYRKKKAFKKAEEYYLKVLAHPNITQNLNFKALAYRNLSVLMEEYDNTEKALKYAFDGLNFQEQTNDELSTAGFYHRIGHIHSKTEAYSESLIYLEKALAITEKVGAKEEMIPILERISYVYAAQEDWKSGFVYLKQHYELKAEVYNDDKATSIAEMQAKFEVSQKQRETEILRASQAKIQDYADRLEASNQELDQFAKVASHDMKEPLRMISSFLALIKRKVRAYKDEDLDEYLNYAIDGSKRMDKLISEILNLARINTKKRAFVEVDLNEVMFDATQNMIKTFEERGATLTNEAMPAIQGDYMQLLQLFQNIISNGFKYNQSDNPAIKVTVEEQEDFYKFEIIDNGIGIKPEDLDKVFGMMQRLNTRNKYEGTGIGLAVCKKIVERHGGKIWVESIYGEGSQFHFTISKNLGNAQSGEA